MKPTAAKQAKLYVEDRDRALRLFATCVNAMSDSEKQKLSVLMMKNIHEIAKSDPSAETAMMITAAIGALVVGEFNAHQNALKQKAEGN
jgi:hypothetical protein